MRKVLVTMVLLSLLTTGFLFAGGQDEVAADAPKSLVVTSRLSPKADFAFNPLIPKKPKLRLL